MALQLQAHLHPRGTTRGDASASHGVPAHQFAGADVTIVWSQMILKRELSALDEIALNAHLLSNFSSQW
jgi:hypothetical protein